MAQTLSQTRRDDLSADEGGSTTEPALYVVLEESARFRAVFAFLCARSTSCASGVARRARSGSREIAKRSSRSPIRA